MKLQIKIEPSESKKVIIVTPEQLGHSEEEWMEMDEDEQFDSIENYLDLLEPPYWEINEIETI